jgi:hypothetical protein
LIEDDPPTNGHSAPITTMKRTVGVFERICQHHRWSTGRDGPGLSVEQALQASHRDHHHLAAIDTSG